MPNASARHLFGTTAIAVVLFVNPALAADITLDSWVDRVTVYPQGADVSRLGEATLDPGTHRLTLGDLPDGVDPNSIRLEAEGSSRLVLGSVDVARVAAGQADEGERQRIEDEIEALGDRWRELDDEIANANLQIGLLQRLATGPIAFEDHETAASDWPEIFDFIGAEIAPLRRTIRTAEIAQRGIGREIDQLKRELEALAVPDIYLTEVAFDVTAADAFSGDITIRYRVAAARWQPFYDVRLSTSEEAAGLTLVRRASIEQRSGEAWDNAEIVLATATPGRTLSAPQPGVLVADLWEPDDEIAIRAADEARIEPPSPAPSITTADAAEAEEQYAALTETGFDATYAIPGRVSVPATGAAKTVLIGEEMVDATLTARTVPALDPVAYLSAAVTLTGPVVLPGEAALYRDGVYVGETWLDLIPPDTETEIGFGADDFVTVEHVALTNRRGETGVFTNSNTDLSDWTIIVTNRHQRPIDIVIFDRLPQARDERIEIKPLGTNTPADETDAEDTPGLTAWRETLAAGDAKEIRFGYEIVWPEEGELIIR